MKFAIFLSSLLFCCVQEIFARKHPVNFLGQWKTQKYEIPSPPVNCSLPEEDQGYRHLTATVIDKVNKEH
eukprot:Awhi_evm2s15548